MNNELTDTEDTIVKMILSGKSRQQIAKERGTAKGTVNKQIENIYAKLGVLTKEELLDTVRGLFA